jgi:hypothetical protein
MRSREGIEEKKIARLFLLFLRGFAPSREVSHFPLRFDDGEEVGGVGGGGDCGWGGWGRWRRGWKMSHAKTRRREGIKEVEIDLFSLPFLRGFATSREVSYFLLCFDDGEEVGGVGGEVRRGAARCGEVRRGAGRKMSHAKPRRITMAMTFIWIERLL